MSWTDERVALLTKMWNEGKSASQIAKELGGVTRNAVMGKVHRLGISSRVPGAASEDKAAQEKSSPEANKQAVEEKDAPEADVQAAEESESKEAVKKTAQEESSDAEEVQKEDAGGSNLPVAPEIPPSSVSASIASRPQQLSQPNFRALIAAGQPLPPQPSANEISAEALARVSEVEREARKLSLLELTEKTCKWPIGDPATEDFWFCGLPVEPGKPYCDAHVGVAFQPMSSRRDRRR